MPTNWKVPTGSLQAFLQAHYNYANCIYTWEETSINAVFLMVSPSFKVMSFSFT